MHTLAVKICGITARAALDAAIESGVEMIGLVHFEKSPRHLDIETMQVLARAARGKVQIVILTVNAEDGLLAALHDAVRPDWWQFHGAEEAARIEAVRSRFGRPVMKAVGVSNADDVEHAAHMASVADRLLLDAKPPKDADRPGGLGATFDWSLLSKLDEDVSFMLSGGLTIDNVADAVHQTSAMGVDVSSGVESAPGVKDPDLIKAFVAAARQDAGAIQSAPAQAQI
ncbi:MAG: phosphoribosylanthranilate isomerase [Pseudomonadota bacterium]